MSTDTPPTAAAPDMPKKSARTRSATLLGRAFAGLVAAGSVLAVGELLSVPIGTNASPFFAVGSFMVDNSPEAGREFAIKTFGTNDKLALFIGMSIGIAVLAVVAGILERARRPIGSAMLVALGAVGV